MSEVRKLISKEITGTHTTTITEVTGEWGTHTETSTETHAVAYRTPEQINQDDYQMGVNTFYDDRKDRAWQDEQDTEALLAEVDSPFMNGLIGADIAHQIKILQERLELLDALEF